MQGLIRLAKANPGELDYSSSGSGGANHLAGELFNSMAGLKMVHIPYKGNAPSLIKGGKLRALAVTSKSRFDVAPELPTLHEAGLNDYEAVAWTGLGAPALTPLDMVKRINAAVVKVVNTADFRERLKAGGLAMTS